MNWTAASTTALQKYGTERHRHDPQLRRQFAPALSARSRRRPAISRRRRQRHSTGFSTSNGTLGWIRNLPLRSPHAEDWRKILAALPARSNQSLGQIARGGNRRSPPESSDRTNAFRAAARLAGKLEPRKPRPWIARHPEDRMNEKLVRAARAVLGEFEKPAGARPTWPSATRSWRKNRSTATSMAGRRTTSPQRKNWCAPPKAWPVSTAN